jgi:FAD/FMN-containing dehydrogenase
MTIFPANQEELRETLSAANAKRERITAVDLQAFTRVVDYQPADMTITAEAGLTLTALQARLAEHGQWLPLDPAGAEQITLEDLLNANLSGPRRFGYGTVREHLLGLKIALADGRIIKSGGKVVKNVAGYDLLKLFVNSHGTLGVIVEATFKVRPKPDQEEFVATTCPSFDKAGGLIEAVLASELAPVVFDLHNLSPPNPQSLATLVLGFAGTRREVEWQTTKAATLFHAQPASLDYDKHFWRNGSTGPTQRLSVLPSRLASAVQMLGAAEFVARAGNGAIYYRGGLPPPKSEAPANLMRRIKDIFDPNHVFPELAL